ncbi:maleylpyruvate isomerase family mycothiol-dependent enzyme [Micromonospora sp. NPDC047738]|uniref:maleylpyruvate isomerase family mycothiol-dependent enzyme n=1 Tax=unclassified Micromonospora TaxID=2617518 RepID=UPI0033DFC9B7
MDTWQMIKAERASLVDALDKLSDADWDQPSLCVNWTVREVVAHLVATANMTPPKFFAKLVGNGFSFQNMVRKDIAQVTAGRTNAELVDLLRSRVDARTAPPGPTLSWLGETIVHGEDIFRAVGIAHQHPAEHVVAVADFYKSSNLLIGAKSRISGVTLRATDTDWQHGSGPEVSGPVIALLMAMTGRKAALNDLTGDGVAVLRERD